MLPKRILNVILKSKKSYLAKGSFLEVIILLVDKN